MTVYLNPNRGYWSLGPLVKHGTEAPKPKACTSHALYTVVTDDAEHNVCGPHTYMMMGQLIGEHPHYAGEDPSPGTPCDYLEVSR